MMFGRQVLNRTLSGGYTTIAVAPSSETIASLFGGMAWLTDGILAGNPSNPSSRSANETGFDHEVNITELMALLASGNITTNSTTSHNSTISDIVNSTISDVISSNASDLNNSSSDMVLVPASEV